MNKKFAFSLCLAILFLAVFTKNTNQAGPGDEAFNAANKEFKALLADDARAGRGTIGKTWPPSFLKSVKTTTRLEMAPRALYMHARCREELGLRSRRKGDFKNACKFLRKWPPNIPSTPGPMTLCCARRSLSGTSEKTRPRRARLWKGFCPNSKTETCAAKPGSCWTKSKAARPRLHLKGKDGAIPRAGQGAAQGGGGASGQSSGQSSTSAAEDKDGVLRSITVRASNR